MEKKPLKHQNNVLNHRLCPDEYESIVTNTNYLLSKLWLSKMFWNTWKLVAYFLIYFTVNYSKYYIIQSADPTQVLEIT